MRYRGKLAQSARYPEKLATLPVAWSDGQLRFLGGPAVAHMQDPDQKPEKSPDTTADDLTPSSVYESHSYARPHARHPIATKYTPVDSATAVHSAVFAKHPHEADTGC